MQRNFNNASRLNAKKKNQPKKKQISLKVRRLTAPFAMYGVSFLDLGGSFTVSDATLGISQMSILNGLLGVAGLAQQYPQHFTPTSFNGNFRLRGKIFLEYIELNYQMTGSVGNLIATPELHNSMRLAILRVGENYSNSAPAYLTGVTNGADLVETSKVYYDIVRALPSQAFDSAGDNVPMVINDHVLIPIQRTLNIYSLNSTGSGAWDTEKENYAIEAVSDSAVLPHPTLDYNCRFWFRTMHS